MSNYDAKKIMIVDKVCVVLALIAGLFLSIGTVVMFANMLTRTVADVNISFTYELCGLCSAGVASFAIPFATFTASHSQMDIITSHMPKRMRGWFEGISGIITMVVLVFTVAILVMYAYDRTLAMETTTPSGLPTWIFRWLFAIGMLATLVGAALEMIDMFRMALGKNVVFNSAELVEQEAEKTEMLEKEEPQQIEEKDDDKDPAKKDGGEDK